MTLKRESLKHSTRADRPDFYGEFCRSHQLSETLSLLEMSSVFVIGVTQDDQTFARILLLRIDCWEPMHIQVNQLQNSEFCCASILQLLTIFAHTVTVVNKKLHSDIFLIFRFARKILLLNSHYLHCAMGTTLEKSEQQSKSRQSIRRLAASFQNDRCRKWSNSSLFGSQVINIHIDVIFV